MTQYKSIRDFVRETKPTDWLIESLEEDLYQWKRSMAWTYNLKLDEIISIRHDFERERSFLVIPSLDIDFQILSEEKYNKRLEEINNPSWNKADVEDEEFMSEFFRKQGCQDFKNYGWLFYKTSEEFILFTRDGSSDYRIFAVLSGNLRLSYVR